MSLKAFGIVFVAAVVSNLLPPLGASAEPAASVSDQVTRSLIPPQSIPEHSHTATGFACKELEQLSKRAFICDGYTYEIDASGSIQVLSPPYVSGDEDQLQQKAEVTK